MIERKMQSTNPIQSIPIQCIPIQSIRLYWRSLITDSIDVADYDELCIYMVTDIVKQRRRHAACARDICKAK